MAGFSKIVELKGHIIDSLTLPKVLDEILERGGNYQTEEIRIGKTKKDQSYARVRVSASSQRELDKILKRIYQLGALPQEEKEATLIEADQEQAFPLDFYVTTGLPTSVFIKGQWVPVERICLDCGIRVNEADLAATAVKFYEVKKGDKIVVGSSGVRVTPVLRYRPRGLPGFLLGSVSAEKSKWRLIQEIAQSLRQLKRKKKEKSLFVLGDAVIHTGCRQHICNLIQAGFIDLIIAGNGLAGHDLEASMFGTSRGVPLAEGGGTPSGHDQYLHAINVIRRAGGIKKAVEAGLVKDGILYNCLKHGVDFLLLGSVQDEGPLPEGISDAIEAQRLMREKFVGIGMAVMIATMHHSSSVAKLLPHTVRVAVVDINPAVVGKIAERSGFQTLGLVTDAELFLRELTGYLCPGMRHWK